MSADRKGRIFIVRMRTHGAAKDCWFQHLAVEVPGEESRTEWCEAVTDEVYGKLD